MRHSLSYSHSDQALLRDPNLDHCWDGLVVPGTLATYYFEGTGGFVLTRRKPYVIDPRTPLLQTLLDVRRPPPKASHLELAAIHDPEVGGFWPEREIDREHWEDGRWPEVVRRVLGFQVSYGESATAKIDKYNKLLVEAGVEFDPAPPDSPQRLIPPYWAVSGVADPWWDLSREAIEIGADDHRPESLWPVLCTRSTVDIGVFASLVQSVSDSVTEVFCWASEWDEATATEEDVLGWLRTVEEAERLGIRVRNLYGGYLSVLLLARGLAGVNHGVGYSESRDARRLGATGAPPTRYYVPALHKFYSVPTAQPIIDHLPTDWACDCAVCTGVTEDGTPEIGRLTVEELKRHFLLSRHREIRDVDRDVQAVLRRLEEVGEWVVAHTTPFLPRSDGERLRNWARIIGAE